MCVYKPLCCGGIGYDVTTCYAMMDCKACVPPHPLDSCAWAVEPGEPLKVQFVHLVVTPSVGIVC